MALQVLHDESDHYHAYQAQEANIEFLKNYKGKDGFFLKKFLIDDTFNLNDWRVTWEAIQKDAKDFIGKPLVLTPDIDHPSVEDQEDYRVGNIIDVQLDPVNRRAIQISEVFDERTQKLIEQKKIRFGSPTVLPFSLDTREQRFTGTSYQQDILHRFRPAHDAIVANPAYTKDKNKFAAVCKGKGEACAMKLLAVNASVEYRKRYEADFEEQLAIGIKVEMEHTTDPEIAKKIALDHLKEDSNYYTKLAKIFSDVPKSAAEVNGTNIDQITIVDFVKSVNKRFNAETLAGVIENIRSTKEASTDSCVEKKIRIISNEHPEWDNDKIVAVAFSYCDEKKASTPAEIDMFVASTIQNTLAKQEKHLSKLDASLKTLQQKIRNLKF